MHPAMLHPDRLFSANPAERELARRLYDTVKDLPIISPHGHTDPAWFASNAPFADPATLFIRPDHYIFRMLYSQGIPLESLGIGERQSPPAHHPRDIWRLFARNYYLFQGTPSRLWFDHALSEVFGIEERLTPDNADRLFDIISDCLNQEAFRPRALFDRFNIEFLATTESPLDDLQHHAKIRASAWPGRVVTTYRPDPVVDPSYEGFAENLSRLGELTGEDTLTWHGYLRAHRNRRDYFRQFGATATDHGHPTATTADLPDKDAERLFQRISRGAGDTSDAELFRGQMLTEMARMSLDDGMVMQIHAGSFRNHNAPLHARFGRDMGADIPMRTNFVDGLRPLLGRFGNETSLSIILFTLDETTWSRELAPLAGHYPALKLGPPWWFFDSPEGMLRFKRGVLETAGFYNTAGFNDDTRAFLSIPARHDVNRRMDCRHLAELVCDHRLDEAEAADIARLLACDLAKAAYRITQTP